MSKFPKLLYHFLVIKCTLLHYFDIMRIDVAISISEKDGRPIASTSSCSVNIGHMGMFFIQFLILSDAFSLRHYPSWWSKVCHIYFNY